MSVITHTKETTHTKDPCKEISDAVPKYLQKNSDVISLVFSLFFGISFFSVRLKYIDNICSNMHN